VRRLQEFCTTYTHTRELPKYISTSSPEYLDHFFSSDIKTAPRIQHISASLNISPHFFDYVATVMVSPQDMPTFYDKMIFNDPVSPLHYSLATDYHVPNPLVSDRTVQFPQSSMNLAQLEQLRQLLSCVNDDGTTSSTSTQDMINEDSDKEVCSFFMRTGICAYGGKLISGLTSSFVLYALCVFVCVPLASLHPSVIKSCSACLSPDPYLMICCP
jgi:hypothetical protein